MKSSPRLALSLLLALSAPAMADVRLSSVFGSHMVLQRETEVALWGWAEPGERITVRASWHASPLVAKADANRNWAVMLPTPGAGGPHEIVVEGTNRIVLEDVLIGEVWLASGQSNMEMAVGNISTGYTGVLEHERVIADATHHGIRFCTIPNVPSVTPAADCEGARWVACSPETVETFSATAYFFGRALHDELKIPIGLIASDWGGTPAQAWTSEESLRAIEYLPDIADQLALLDQVRADPTGFQAENQRRFDAWWSSFAQHDPGTDKRWMAPGVADADWREMELPNAWGGELDRFDGTVWFRKEIELPAEWSERDLVLSLGPIDDMDAAWVNGIRVGGMEHPGSWNTPRRYPVPAAVSKPGRNVIAVRALDTGGAGGMTGKPDQLTIGPEDTEAPLALAGSWRYQVGASMEDTEPYPSPIEFDSDSATALFNGMIHPIAGFGIRGAIWYQGESNRRQADAYRTLFPQMIRDWRAQWGRDAFPFYFVQIAPYAYEADQGRTGELREAQRLALSLPNTGMVVTMDVGEAGDIHPKNKQAVGQRLALWALARTYGQDRVCSGPLYSSMSLMPGAIRVAFDHVRGGLEARAGALSHFTIAGADRRFVPAQARIDGDSVVVSNADVPFPVAVRFAQGAADEPNFFNADGLPASPFRTDEWRFVTARE